MRPRVGFGDFVAARGPALLAATSHLAQDPARAERLLADAMARAYESWGRVADDPEPFVRQAIAQSWGGLTRADEGAQILAASGLRSQPLPDGFMDDIRSAVGRHARSRRAQLLVTVVVVALLVVAAAGPLTGGVDETFTESDSQLRVLQGTTRDGDPDERLPLYDKGSKLNAQLATVLPTTSATMPIGPLAPGAVVAVVCDATVPLRAVVSIDGRVIGTTVCFEWVVVEDSLALPTSGRVSVTVDVVDMHTGRPPKDADGVFRVGWYMPVDWDAFPFPDRPDELRELRSPFRSDPALALAAFDAREVGTQRPVQDVVMPASLQVSSETVAPGRLRVLVSGVEVWRRDSWDYLRRDVVGPAVQADDPRLVAAGVRVGEVVSVEVVAEEWDDPAWSVLVRAAG